jgi:hypothetical protein
MHEAFGGHQAYDFNQYKHLKWTSQSLQVKLMGLIISIWDSKPQRVSKLNS